jgi:ribosomal protein S18 acetylase RimI-like enzyme
LERIVNPAAMEIRVVDKPLEQPLAEFFRALAEAGDEKFFHPHPLTSDEAREHANYSGKDLYYALVEGDRVIGYGMLRGWDEGYEIPSLGIAMHPSVRGFGLGELFMRFLHAAARRRGCEKIRISVYRQNTEAMALYKKLGYCLESEQNDKLVGFVTL